MTRGDAGDLYDAARSLKRTARLDLYERAGYSVAIT